MAINFLSSRCARWLRVLNSGMLLSGGCGELGVSGGGFPGVFVGGKTGSAVAARHVDHRRGSQNKFVAALTRFWHGVLGLGRVATLGSGGSATLGYDVNEGGGLGGDIGCFGGQNIFVVAWTASSQ